MTVPARKTLVVWCQVETMCIYFSPENNAENQRKKDRFFIFSMSETKNQGEKMT